ncbi:hypothetical protein JG687_00003189 [Phytophthora cactorum]|uniref:Uncharacterized protein n=1 Tax=Phytophthora cactorum TaxID=29920 RepID=A0A8T1UWC5_9STRA|nr:hypothetical protein JG687_00003189 [Phytophthora cactorum]
MKIELILVKEWLVSHEVLATASKTIVLVVILEQMWKALRLTLTMRMEPSEVGLLLLKVSPKPVEKPSVKAAAVAVVLQLVWKALHLAVMELEPQLVSSGVASRVGERDDVAGVVREDGSDNLARIGGYDLAAGVILVVVKFELGSVLLVLKVVLVQDPVKHPNVLSVLLHPWYISSW